MPTVARVLRATLLLVLVGLLLAPAALVLIFVGTAGACLAGTTLPGAIGAMKWLVAGFTAKKPDMEGVQSCAATAY